MNLLDDVEAFLLAHAVSATAFGRMSLRDRHFVRQLREGRRVWPETEAKVRRFMATYRPEGADTDHSAAGDHAALECAATLPPLEKAGSIHSREPSRD